MSGRTPDPDDVSVTKTETLPSCSLNPIWVRSTRLVSTQVKVVNWRVTKSRKSYMGEEERADLGCSVAISSKNV